MADGPSPRGFLIDLEMYIVDHGLLKQMEKGVLSTGSVASMILWLNDVDWCGDETDGRHHFLDTRRRIAKLLRDVTGNSVKTVQLQHLHIVLNELCAPPFPILETHVVKLYSDMHTVPKLARRRATPTASASGSTAVAAFSPGASEGAVVAGPAAYQFISAPELLGILVKRDEENARLKSQVMSLTKSRQYYVGKVADLRLQFKNATDNLEHHKSEVLLRKHSAKSGGHLSTMGGYTLALKHQHGMVGAEAIVKMVGGESIRGSLEHKGIITRWEHRACYAIHTMSAEFVQANEALLAEPFDNTLNSEEALRTVLASRAAAPSSIRVTLYSGDATHSEAVQKMKVHVSYAAMLSVTASHIAECLNIDNDHTEPMLNPALNPSLLEAAYICMPCDLQPVYHGSGEELYYIILKELSSAGMPDWLPAASASVAADPHADGAALDKGTVFNIRVHVLDNGPDNQGSSGRIMRIVSGDALQAMSVIWCFLHQYSLVVGDSLLCLDNFVWGVETGDNDNDKSYYSRLGTIVNTWRSTGIKKKVLDCGSNRFGDVVALQLLSKTPGKCIRTRWGSTDQAEEKIMNGGMILATVFQELFGKDVERKSKKPSGGGGEAKRLCADEDADFKENQRKWRLLAAKYISDDKFQAMVYISFTVKQLVTTWYHKYMQSVKKYNVHVKLAERFSRGAYVGGPVEICPIDTAEIERQIADCVTHPD